MGTTDGTLLVTDDPDIRGRLAQALGDDDLLTPIAHCDSVRQAHTLIGQGPSDLVIVDIRRDPDVALGVLGVLVDTHPNSRFVVIASGFEERLVVDAMQAGARHFLTESWITPDIVPICRELVEQVKASSRRRGAIVTILSAGGGSGATTLAINLAAELGKLADEKPLLVDLDSRFGGVGTHLGLSGQYGIADLLQDHGYEDHELVRSTAVEHDKSIDVLLSPAAVDFENPAPLDPELLVPAIESFAHIYPVVCVDAPTGRFEELLAIAEASTAVLVVTQPTVRDLTHGRTLLASLASRALDTPVYAIANRYRKIERRGPRSVPLDEARKTLEHMEDLLTVADDAVSCQAALNAAQTLAQAAPKCQTRRDLGSIASLLNTEYFTPEEEIALDPPKAKRA